MTRTIQDASPVRPASSSEDVPPMSRHSLVDPCPPAWPEALSSSGSFLPIGSVVPISVLSFAPDGTAEDIVPDPTVIPPAVALWAEKELAHIPSWEPESIPDPGGDHKFFTPHCAHRFFTTLPCGTRIPFFCTEPPKHQISHMAKGAGPEELASAPNRKPSPRSRKSVAS